MYSLQRYVAQCAKETNLLGFELRATAHASPADETPVLVDTPRERNLFADLGAGRACKEDLGQVGLDAHDTATGRCRANVDHEHLVLCQLLHLGLFLVIRLDTEQAAQQKVVDLELRVNGRELANLTEHLTYEAVGVVMARRRRRS